MYVEEVCIDGFKSYAQRTVVPAFDPLFNAITGLNGSGKSNILDSICFVLGITNLSQVRAASLQELVYKQGQAGVTKASVSITFNNADKSRSPVGYEHCDQIIVTRQIVIGGRNKYLINGHVAQPTRVQNLFHSVQLNVNNPHFLIMQGRITKVLNMKPPEILGMLEEAAGTRMYETKKDAALKTLEKKQTKVDEIDKLLEEEILPTIEKLRKERGDYMKWQLGNDSLERLRRFCVAWEFSRCKEAVEGQSEGETAVKSQLEELDARAHDRAAQGADVEAEMKRVAKEKASKAGGAMTSASAEVDELSKELVKHTAAWTHKKDAVKAEKKNVEKFQKQAQKHEEATAKEAERLDQLAADADARAEALKDAELKAEKAEISGSGAGGDGDKSLQTQLTEANASVADATASAKNAALTAKHCEKELAAGGGESSTNLDALEAECETKRKILDKAQEKVDVLNGHLAGLDFKFKDPEAKFDRSRVKGVVAKLMQVKDPAMSTALEVVAGGKLYQVVVDTEVTGKALLSKGQLQKRVTIIPLNKIDARTCSNSQCAAAERVSHGDAKLALSLVTCDAEVEAVMAYVFGKAFVCKDAATARAVAFDKDVLTNCVTVEGDLLNPGGLLTGGSRNNGNSVLAKLHALHSAETALDAAKASLAEVESKLKECATAAKASAKLEAALDQAEHALGLVRQKCEGSESHQLGEKVAKLEADLAAAKEAGAAADEKKATASETAAMLKKEIESFAKERDSRLKAAEKALKDARTAVNKARADVKSAEGEMTAARVERESAAAEKDAIAENIAQAEAAVAELELEAAELEKEVERRRAAYDERAAALDALKSELAACDKESARLQKTLAKMEREADADAVERKKLEHKLARMEKDADESRAALKALREEHPWIDAEERYFGEANGDYDFDARDPVAATEELAKAESEQASLAKRINKKVIAMFDKAEAEFKALQEKRRIVLNDRSKIEAVIGELDEKKKEALKVTWEKVTGDFGSIFSTLLPGTTAKLEPPEGESFLAGLEVRVAFGGVWKESLTELSGGQRSLLALSLILALLLFKPAPIYILDEVDAALDLSHTQNIGRMIRAHFPYSQFIVVSLKEGMFNNANCIFRTKFVDGVSTVTRTVPALKAADNASEMGGIDAASKKRAAAKGKVGRNGAKENVPA
ncbi:condensin complex component [Micromonas commoda]|uniref:Structural maintenance of chromosomes protein n=1 Tax=Micromonas commoda (strain RCC299 / NOUM17 / CCMP2709) TaxID=296587 RepID=C1ED21_MICCC|nr:condensin complex component [Micromonas commoda]ACO66004.1 condensin complex component [Micromonas commoda]|eukprot:XP_002504746.1 condensin complex component [Micromonas commoda]